MIWERVEGKERVNITVGKIGWREAVGNGFEAFLFQYAPVRPLDVRNN